MDDILILTLSQCQKNRLGPTIHFFLLLLLLFSSLMKNWSCVSRYLNWGIIIKRDDIKHSIQFLFYFLEQLTIGIPTILRQRAGGKYFEQTLKSLVRHISEQERNNVTILCNLCDFNKTSRDTLRR